MQPLPPLNEPIKPFTSQAATAWPRVLSVADLGSGGQPVTWLWDGYLARGSITVLTSQWKAGKTTLLSLLLARMNTGGTLAGRAVAKARAVIVSEEHQSLWQDRARRLELGDHALFCRPFSELPDMAAWNRLLDHLAELHASQGIDLIVIDPLIMFFPLGAECNAELMRQALEGLRRLTIMGMSVLVLHHPKKGTLRPGQGSRGTGLLPGMADIVIEMFPYCRLDLPDPRRRLHAYSRHAATPPLWLIELNAAHTDYSGRMPNLEDDVPPSWQPLCAILAAAQTPLTIKEILYDWEPGLPTPASNTLWRWLDQAAHQGLIVKSGTGSKKDPFRYRLSRR